MSTTENTTIECSEFNLFRAQLGHFIFALGFRLARLVAGNNRLAQTKNESGHVFMFREEYRWR